MDNQDSPVLHGYSVGMYYSMPVLIELLLQITSGSASSIYTNSTLGQGEVNYESVVPMALLHSLVIFGGLSLGAAKIRQASLDSPVPTVGGKSRVTVVLKKKRKIVQTGFATHPSTLLWPCFFFVGRRIVVLLRVEISTRPGRDPPNRTQVGGKCGETLL